MTIPRIISVDDHVVEPPDLWLRYLPAKYSDVAPRVERVKGVTERSARHAAYRPDPDGEDADCWLFEGVYFPITSGLVEVGLPETRRQTYSSCVTFDDILPGAYQVDARLADMDMNNTEACLCFPTFPRFCGQTFLEYGDRDLAVACIRAYNDWMIDEWCGGAGHGRLIPLTLIPMWDVELAALEVRRCADKGAHAIAFSESPTALGLPSIFYGHWDALWDACQTTDTVVNMHIGSSSQFVTTGPDSPALVPISLAHSLSEHALADWLCSGVLERFSKLRVALSEGQIGWMPYLLERLDRSWRQYRRYGQAINYLPEPPSSYVAGRVFGCVFDDVHGLANRDQIGVEQIMFEVDYPHGDSTWPKSTERILELISAVDLSPDEVAKIVRGNAVRCYGLNRFGIAA
jgi:predicted TIM-barrel fold metal-dependent hydrolase